MKSTSSSDGYVRRVSAGGSSNKGNGKVVVTLSDFGKAVSVTPPAASQTADASALMSSFKLKLFKRG